MTAQPSTDRRPATPGKDTTAAAAGPAPRREQAEAHRLLVEARDQLTLALDALTTDDDPRKAAEIVGRSSDRIGQALYYMRLLHRA